MKINLAKKTDQRKIQKFIESYEPGHSKKRFKCIMGSHRGFSVYEVDPEGTQSPTLAHMDHMFAICKIYNLGFMIAVNIGSNTPHYYVY